MRNIALLALTCLAAPASFGQTTTYFEDTFDTGLENWTVRTDGPTPGAWHWTTVADPCVPGTPDIGGVARMGDPDCTFNSVGSQVQVLELTTPVYIPPQANAPRLEYSYYAQSEACFHWDFHYVDVRRVGETHWSSIGGGCGQNNWFTSTRPLDAYRGDSIHVRFHFDPIDASNNDGRGWIVDDVRIVAAGCTAMNYCGTTPNSASGVGARMGFSGSAEIQLNDLVLEVSDAPPNEFALLFCGPDRIDTPLGDGRLCVGPGTVGIMRLGPVFRFDGTGRASFPFDLGSDLIAAGEFLPGTNWQFQCWFRDGAGGPSGSNLSDALSITFCP